MVSHVLKQLYFASERSSYAAKEEAMEQVPKLQKQKSRLQRHLFQFNENTCSTLVNILINVGSLIDLLKRLSSQEHIMYLILMLLVYKCRTREGLIRMKHKRLQHIS